MAETGEGFHPAPLLILFAFGPPVGEQHAVDGAFEGGFIALGLDGGARGLDREAKIERVEATSLEELVHRRPGIAVAQVEKTGRGVGEVVERRPELGEIDHLDGAGELAAPFEDVGHAQGVGGLEIAPFELAVEVVGAVVGPQPRCLSPQTASLRRQRGNGLQQLGRFGRSSHRVEPARQLDQAFDHRRMWVNRFFHGVSRIFNCINDDAERQSANRRPGPVP